MAILSRRCHVLPLLVLLFFPASLHADEDRQVVTFFAVGDVMLGRHIGKLMSDQGFDRPFRDIAPALQTADIVFGNLEAPIAAENAVPFFPEKPYSFHASPRAAAAVKKAGFTVLSLANNHALDFGPGSLAETRSLLAAQGLSVFGGGKDLAEARRPVILTRKGIRFGFLGYGVAHSRRVYANAGRPGIAPIVMKDIRKDIEAVRKDVDVLILSLHWGMEYESLPSQLQRMEAHQLIDWGADMIIGHHPHVMQGIEVYKNRVIAYSLGNFIFDQKGKGTDRSYILAATFTRKGMIGGRVIPLDRKKRYYPAVAAGAAAEAITAEVKRISVPLKTGKQQMVLVGLDGIDAGKELP